MLGTNQEKKAYGYFRYLVFFLVLIASFKCSAEEALDRTIKLTNGEIQRTLHIPAEYILKHSVRDGTGGSIWLYFTYPEMQPANKSAKPGGGSVSLLIALRPPRSKKTRSEMQLDDLENASSNLYPSSPYLTHYVGKIDGIDVFEEANKKSGLVIRTYFTHDGKNQLISYVEPNTVRMTGYRNYATVFELRYVFSRSLISQKLEIDKSITKLMEELLQP